MYSVDQKEAYLSVIIAKQHGNFLRFVWEETTYEFTCLPFGLCSAPSIFTKLLRPLVAHQGLRTVIYLDNMLNMAEGRETLQQQVHQAFTLLEKLGFAINISKPLSRPDHLPRTPGGLCLNKAVPDRRNCSR